MKSDFNGGPAGLLHIAHFGYRKRARRTLGFEQCERRDLLAADLADRSKFWRRQE